MEGSEGGRPPWLLVAGDGYALRAMASAEAHSAYRDAPGGNGGGAGGSTTGGGGSGGGSARGASAGGGSERGAHRSD